MNNIETLCLMIEKYCENNIEDLTKEQEIVSKIYVIMKNWCSNKTPGQHNNNFNCESYNIFFKNFIHLLLKFRNSEDVEKQKFAKNFLFSSTDVPIYRFLNLKFDAKTKTLKEDIVYDNNFCSWTLCERSNYLESKMSKGTVRVTAYLNINEYGIKVEKMGFSQQFEKEVIFSFRKENISKIEIIVYKDSGDVFEVIDKSRI